MTIATEPLNIEPVFSRIAQMVMTLRCTAFAASFARSRPDNAPCSTGKSKRFASSESLWILGAGFLALLGVFVFVICIVLSSPFTHLFSIGFEPFGLAAFIFFAMGCSAFTSGFAYSIRMPLAIGYTCSLRFIAVLFPIALLVSLMVIRHA